MAENMEVRIPDSEKKPLERLHALSEAAFLELCQALLKARPGLDASAFVEQVVKSWSGTISAREVDDIVQIAVRAARTSAVYGTSKKDMISALAQLPFQTSEMNANPNDLLTKRLNVLMEIESVRLTAVAGVFLSSQVNVYQGAKVYSDIRPVFLSEDGMDQDPVASVVAHHLQFSIQSNGSTKTFHVALDDDDLLELRNTLDKTVRRSETIREAEQKAGRLVIR